MPVTLVRTIPRQGDSNGNNAVNASSHDSPPGRGQSNQNPGGLGLRQLIVEDFRTHGSKLTEPGFWALAVHRFGNARMAIQPKLLRAPLTLAYDAMSLGVNWVWGIDLSYVVKVGRRVRIWHHGGIVLGARSIGDDVHIRHNTTLGLVRRGCGEKPTIGNRVDIGVGACVLGSVTVEDDCVIGANTVVLRDLPAGSTVLGVPARPVNLKSNDARPSYRCDDQ